MNRIVIKLKNKNHDFCFGLGFMGNLLEQLDCSIDELMQGIQKNPFKFIPVLMFESYAYGCKRENKEKEHDLYSFTDVIDDEGGVVSEKVSKFLEAFTESMTKNVPKEPIRKGKPKASQVKK